MARKFWRGGYLGEFEYDANSGSPRGPYSIDDTGDTNPPENNGSSQTRLYTSATNSFVAGEMVEMSGDYSDFDGPWEILAIDTTSHLWFDIGLVWNAAFAAASFTVEAIVHSNWVDENGDDVVAPAAADVVVYDEHGLICPADTDDVSRFATANKAKQELGNHFNCIADMNQGDIAFEAVIIDLGFTGNIGVYYDRDNDSVAVISPLKLDLAASGELHFRSTRNAYIMCSDNAGGAADVPITIHDCSISGNLYLCSDGVLAAFTEVRVLDKGRLEGIDQYDLGDVATIEEVEEGVRLSSLSVYGSTAEVEIHQKASQLGVKLGTTETFTNSAGSTTATYSSGTPALSIGDILFIEDEARYVTNVVTSTVTVHKAFENAHSAKTGYRLPPMDIYGYAGKIYTNSPIDDLLSADTVQIDVGMSDFRPSARIDIGDAQILGGTTTWRAMGRLRLATVNGGSLIAAGSGNKKIGLDADTGVLVEVLSGICNFSGTSGKFEISSSSFIQTRGGELTLPDNIKIDWTPILTE